MTRDRLVLAGAVLTLVSVNISMNEGSASAQDGINLGEGFDGTGELGFRYDLDAQDPSSDLVDHRFRLRAALGARFVATESLTVVMRMRASSGDDGRDPYVDLGDGLEPLAVAFDRAFLRWQRGGLVANAGLVGLETGSSSLIWDRDLSPAGGSLAYTRRIKGTIVSPQLFAFMTRPDGDAKAAAIVGGELVAQRLIGEADLELAAATYRLARKNALASRPTTNRTDSDGNFESDFEIIEGRARLKLHQLPWLPLELAADVFVNPGADSDKNAFSVGVRTPQRRFGGLLTAGYRFRSVERDALVGALATDDIDLPTNVVGHDVSISFEHQDRVKLTVTAFAFEDKSGDVAGTPIDEGELQLRLYADLTLIF